MIPLYEDNNTEKRLIRDEHGRWRINDPLYNTDKLETKGQEKECKDDILDIIPTLLLMAVTTVLISICVICIIRLCTPEKASNNSFVDMYSDTYEIDGVEYERHVYEYTDDNHKRYLYFKETCPSKDDYNGNVVVIPKE